MTPTKLVPLLAATLAASACSVQIGNGQTDGNATVDVNTPGNGSDGSLSVRAPGFNLSMDIPASIQGEISAGDNDLVYPGARIGGVHVNAGRDHADEAIVEINYASTDGPDRIAAWYRDPARGPDVRVSSASRQGDAMLISGTHEEDRFELRIAPRADGGSEARLVLTDTDR
jgi:hypothetical protein